MAEPSPRNWSLEEFLEWEARQPHRYEFVDGRPVMMAGGSQTHSLIAVNILSAVRPKLRGSPCRPGGSDLRVPIFATGNSRYPDVTIDCGEYRPGANDPTEPTVVFEILSKSTSWFDLNIKLRDYDRTPSIREYVIVHQDEPRVVVWRRSGHGTLAPGDDIVGLEASVDLESVGIAVSLAEIYEELGYEEARPGTG